jgi:uncharacterized protein YrrD
MLTYTIGVICLIISESFWHKDKILVNYRVVALTKKCILIYINDNYTFPK